MAHEPSGLIGHAKHSAQLMAADAFLAAGQKVSGVYPLVQLDLAVSEHGPDRDREGLLALAALVDARTGRFAL